MKLHLDVSAFRVLIENLSRKTGYRQDVLEKDYYVTMILQELSVFQKEGLPAYFKGGTALYKALHNVRRFSEDIDISVDVRNCSRTQGAKRLDRATKKYTSLVRNEQEGFSRRSEVVTYYRYLPVTDYDTTDSLQRFGRVKIEATSFTIAEPHAPLQISPLLYEVANAEQQMILKAQFDVMPFEIQTMTMERVFIDKLFAAEAYSRKANENHRAFEAAKHIYDLTVMLDAPPITALLKNDVLLRRLLEIRLTEEAQRLDGIPGVSPKEFTFFDVAYQNPYIKEAYTIMQNQYVFSATDRISIQLAAQGLHVLKERLIACPAWSEASCRDTQ